MTLQTDDWKGEHLIRSGRPNTQEGPQATDAVARDLKLIKPYEGTAVTAAVISEATSLSKQRIYDLKRRFRLDLFQDNKKKGGKNAH